MAANEWVEVYTSRHASACDERAFVLLALGVTSIMRATTDGFSLLVHPWDVARTAVELQRFGRERSAESVPPFMPLRLHAGALTSASIYVLVIFLIGVASSRIVFGRDWYDAGVLDSARLSGGQWWRAFTALTLHADLAHLLGNAIFGALFGGFNTANMKSKLNIPKNRALADFLPTVTITAKNLATEITNHNVKQKNLQGETNITEEHIENNTSVRGLLVERGIKRENLPASEDIKKLERKTNRLTHENESEKLKAKKND